MSKLDRERWDGRHAQTGEVFPMPPDALRQWATRLPVAGRALDVACGCGAATVWLARRGFVVDAVDVSPVALSGVAALACLYGVAERVRVWEHDLDAGLPSALAHGYDLVSCQRFRDPRLYPALAGALAPRGLLAVTVLSRVGGADGVFRAEPGELLAAFSGLIILSHREADGEASLLARTP